MRPLRQCVEVKLCAWYAWCSKCLNVHPLTIDAGTARGLSSRAAKLPYQGSGFGPGADRGLALPRVLHEACRVPRLANLGDSILGVARFDFEAVGRLPSWVTNQRRRPPGAACLLSDL